MKCFATNVSRIWRQLPIGIRGAGLNLGGRFAEFMARHGDARARWLEMRNKIVAYRLFEGGECVDHSSISQLDPYSRLFAAEGYGYRNVRAALRPEIPARLSPIAVHAGVGLRLAEQTLARLNDGECEQDLLAEFLSTCKQYAWAGYAGIMEESLGLIARTLYPQSIEQLDECLRVVSTLSRKRFWHGVGRGIYFVTPWNGIEKCMNEPPDETAKLNALSGFCFALTLVNLRQPEVFAAFFRRHETVDYSDGMCAALVVWKLSCNEAAETRGIAPVYSREPERLFVAQEEKTDEQYVHIDHNLCRAS
jgi:hypothetical protein